MADIKKNYIYNTAYQIFSIIMPIITVPYVSRVLGSEGIGKYSYTAAYSQYFIILGMLGISMYGRRQIAYSRGDKEKVSKDFCNIYTLQFITTTIAYAIYIFIFVICNSHNRILYLIQSTLIITSIFDISWFFIGLEELKYVMIKNFSIKITAIFAVFLCVKDMNDLGIYALIMGGSGVLAQLIMWTSIRKKIDIYKPTYKYIKSHFKLSMGLFISQLAMQVYVLLDRTMLGIITNDIQVGMYENSQKTIKLVLTLATSLGVVMLPRMSALYSEGKIEEFKRLIYKAFDFINLLSIPMVFGLASIADGFCIWFYGPDFKGIEQLIQVGAIIVFVISWSNILGIQVMLPMGKEREFTKSVTIGAVINLILNLLLIKRFGAMGATISSVVAELVVTIVQLYFLRQLISFKVICKSTYKPLIAGGVMYLVVSSLGRALPSNIIGTFIGVGLGGSIYILMIYMLKHELAMRYGNIFKNKVKRTCSNE